MNMGLQQPCWNSPVEVAGPPIGRAHAGCRPWRSLAGWGRCDSSTNYSALLAGVFGFFPLHLCFFAFFHVTVVVQGLQQAISALTTAAATLPWALADNFMSMREGRAVVAVSGPGGPLKDECGYSYTRDAVRKVRGLGDSDVGHQESWGGWHAAGWHQHVAPSQAAMHLPSSTFTQIRPPLHRGQRAGRGTDASHVQIKPIKGESEEPGKDLRKLSVQQAKNYLLQMGLQEVDLAGTVPRCNQNGVCNQHTFWVVVTGFALLGSGLLPGPTRPPSPVLKAAAARRAVREVGQPA